MIYDAENTFMWKKGRQDAAGAGKVTGIRPISNRANVVYICTQ